METINSENKINDITVVLLKTEQFYRWIKMMFNIPVFQIKKYEYY